MQEFQNFMKQVKNYNFLHLNSMVDKFPLPDLERNRICVEDFIGDLVISGNRVKIFLNIIAALVPNKELDKLPQGILLGNMARLSKLYDSFLLLICEKQSEAAMLIARAIVETSINLKYFTMKINDELCNKFVKSSLSYDKKLWEFVQEKINGKKPKEFE